MKKILFLIAFVLLFLFVSFHPQPASAMSQCSGTAPIPITIDPASGSTSDTYTITIHWEQLNDNDYQNYVKNNIYPVIEADEVGTDKNGKDKVGNPASITTTAGDGLDPNADTSRKDAVVAKLQQSASYTIHVSKLSDPNAKKLNFHLTDSTGTCAYDKGAAPVTLSASKNPPSRLKKGDPCDIALQGPKNSDSVRCEDGVQCHESSPGGAAVCGGVLPPTPTPTVDPNNPATGGGGDIIGYKITPLQTDWTGSEFHEHIIIPCTAKELDDISKIPPIDDGCLKPDEDIFTRINDMNIRNVMITFYGLDPKSNYLLCGSPTDDPQHILQSCINFIFTKDSKLLKGSEAKSYPDPDNPSVDLPSAIRVLACGDGDNQLKFDKDCTWNKKDPDWTDPGGLPKNDHTDSGGNIKNWFHAGHTYHANLIKVNTDTKPPSLALVYDASFYVNHSYPSVYINGKLVATDAKANWYNDQGADAVNSEKDYTLYIASAQSNYNNCGEYVTGNANSGNKDDQGNPITDCDKVGDLPPFDITGATNPLLNGFLVNILGVRPGGADRNHYKVSLISTDSENAFEDNDNQCVVVPDNNNSWSWKLDQSALTDSRVQANVTFPSTGAHGEYTAGNYRLSIAEQVDTAGWKGLLGRGCRGGFEFWRIPIQIVDLGNGKSKIIIPDPPEKDPNGTDLKNLKKNNLVPQSPCADINHSSSLTNKDGYHNNETCHNLKTGLMTFSTDPKTFITQIFSFVLTLGGTAAVILMIVAGYQLMTSEGDKQKLQSARERITSLIIGLLFIIFSLVILQLIAGSILRIPGFF